MSNPITTITDKVMRLTKSMVYLALRVSYPSGATSEDISGFLAEKSPVEADRYHQGLVERALVDLQLGGMVNRSADRWYPASPAH